MTQDDPRETPTHALGPRRAPGEVLTAAEKAGLVRPAADVQPLERPGAGLLLRVLGGLYAWQGHRRADEPQTIDVVARMPARILRE